MSETNGHGRSRIAALYQWIQRAYSEIPFRYLRNGYSFPPWHYYFEVTRRCNLRCKMCQYIDFLEHVSIRKQMEGELSTDEWHRVIDQVQRFSLVTFTGGEPFVRKDFMELLEHASRRARTHFVSNTTMLPEERAERIVALAPRRFGGLGFNFAGTSIEAPGELHDQIRKMRGAFERSMRGVQTLRRLRDRSGKQCPLIHITTVIQQDNVHVLHEMPRVVREFGADVLNLVTETRMHDLPDLGIRDPASVDASEIRWPRVDRNQLAEALDKTESAAKEMGIELRLPRMPREDLLNYYDGTGINLKNYECRNAWNTLIVGRTGDAYPCWIIRIGNVREHTLQELWNNAAMREFRQTCQKKLFAMCPGCCFLDHKSGATAHQQAAAGVASAQG